MTVTNVKRKTAASPGLSSTGTGMKAIRSPRQHVYHRVSCQDFDGIDKMAKFSIPEVDSVHYTRKYAAVDTVVKLEDRVIDALSSIKGEATTRDRTIFLYEKHCPLFYM